MTTLLALGSHRPPHLILLACHASSPLDPSSGARGLSSSARSHPTGYDPRQVAQGLLRIATAERDAGEHAQAANDVESAFIHFAKASTLMLEDLPTHRKFAKLTASQKEAVVLVRFSDVCTII
ncbi:hypothetical protein FS749_000727 [Ceratobasidium sp. UAMH 11750]|nr:hypothetical protein FS749_000727 [Ceratobasidium sp. UAMH 11750]